MKAKLIVNNQEIEVEISEAEYKKLLPKEEKKTGYERANTYHIVDWLGRIDQNSDDHMHLDDEAYDIANYYSSEVVAQDNARADKLMRQLRRFAVEHREKELDWSKGLQYKYSIYYDHLDGKLDMSFRNHTKSVGEICFDSEQTARLAIDAFYNELIWYFTEYKDSL